MSARPAAPAHRGLEIHRFARADARGAAAGGGADAAALTQAGDALELHAIDGVRKLVLVDGVFAPKLSDLKNVEKGLSIRTLRDVLEKGDAALQAQLLAPDNSNPMVALNSAMMTTAW